MDTGEGVDGFVDHLLVRARLDGCLFDPAEPLRKVHDIYFMTDVSVPDHYVLLAKCRCAFLPAQRVLVAVGR